MNGIAYHLQRGRWPYVLRRHVQIAVPALFRVSARVPRYATLANGVLEIFAGYAWNVSSPIVLERAIEPALPHDVFFQMMNTGALSFANFDTVNRLFQIDLEANGISRPVAALHYQAVTRYGWRRAWPQGETA